MKYLFLLISYSLALTISINAQNETCDCKKDLDFVVEKLKKTPSYKKQIKDSRLVEFQTIYNTIVNSLDGPISVRDCFMLLQRQIQSIDDFHINLYHNSNTKIINKPAFETFYSSEELSTLKFSNDDSIEGIYDLGSTGIEIVIIEKPDYSIEGIIFQSHDSLWQSGHLFLKGIKNKFNKYNLIQHKLKSPGFQMLNNITYENDRLLSLKKKGNTNNFEFKTNKTSNWEFKQLNSSVQYLYFGNFSRNESNKKESEKLLDELEEIKWAKNIIVDLRGNTGGASKISNPFFKLLKKSKSKIYILTNSFTISNGEQFTIKLKELNNVIHLGQTTFGAVAYGSNYGHLYTTPSGHFSIYPTDMDFHKYYKYEGNGVDPDIKLDFESNWIDQTLEIMAQHNGLD